MVFLFLFLISLSMIICIAEKTFLVLHVVCLSGFKFMIRTFSVPILNFNEKWGKKSSIASWNLQGELPID